MKKTKAKIKVGIIGIGMVGTPLTRWFEKQGFARGKNLFCYDRGKKEFSDDISEARIVLFASRLLLVRMIPVILQ